MRYEKYKGSNAYILFPDRVLIKSKTIMEALSKGFSHFYIQLSTGRVQYLKSLRKTYLTYFGIALGDGGTKLLSSHASDEILERHYIDKKVVTRAIKIFK